VSTRYSKPQEDESVVVERGMGAVCLTHKEHLLDIPIPLPPSNVYFQDISSKDAPFSPLPSARSAQLTIRVRTPTESCRTPVEPHSTPVQSVVATARAASSTLGKSVRPQLLRPDDDNREAATAGCLSVALAFQKAESVASSHFFKSHAERSVDEVSSRDGVKEWTQSNDGQEESSSSQSSDLSSDDFTDSSVAISSSNELNTWDEMIRKASEIRRFREDFEKTRRMDTDRVWGVKEAWCCHTLVHKTMSYCGYDV